MIAESARIARGVVQTIGEIRPSDLVALVIPGGAGVIGNLCVAGDRPLRALLRVALKGKCCTPVFAPTAEQAMQRLNEYPYDLIITDLALPDLPGMALIEQVRATERYQDAPVIILADHIDRSCVVEAAKLYGARGVGIDIDPRRIKESKANARREGVDDRVDFLMQDIFESDIHEASVVMLYLLPTLNMQIRPKLWKDLAVGTRVVSHAYDMGDWVPDQVEVVTGRSVYLWTVTEENKKRLTSEQ